MDIWNCLCTADCSILSVLQVNFCYYSILTVWKFTTEFIQLSLHCTKPPASAAAGKDDLCAMTFMLFLVHRVNTVGTSTNDVVLCPRHIVLLFHNSRFLASVSVVFVNAANAELYCQCMHATNALCQNKVTGCVTITIYTIDVQCAFHTV